MEKNSHPSRQSKAPTPAQAKSALKKLQLKRPTGHRYHVKAKKTKQQQMIDAMEHARLEEYAMYLNKPWRLLGMNFLIGLARGLGMTIVFVAQEIISANLPGISKWLADLLGLVQSYSVTGLPYND